jgi:CrcB protein
MIETPNIRTHIAIALGAIAGALFRYYIVQWLDISLDTSFPAGIFLVNTSGCFLMGFISTFCSRRFSVTPELFLFLTTGFLGAYTTFSSYELEAAMEMESLQRDILYWIVTPIIGLLSLEMGIRLSEYCE